MRTTHIKKGLSIVELVIAVAVITVFLSAIIFSFSSFLKLASNNVKNVKASFLAEEGIEVVRFLKTTDWQTISPLTIGQNYYLQFSGTTWQITSTANTIDEFIRVVTFSGVYRDAQGRIVQSGGTLDDETRKVTVTLSWLSGTATISKSMTTYISHI